MLWTTKSRLRVARAATVWLIRRFIDADASFRFVDTDAAVLALEREGAVGFHVRGTRYPTPDAAGRTAFEALAFEHAPDDAALRAMARVVHDADRGVKVDPAPEAAGLLAMTVSFPEVAGDDEIVDRSALVYDSLYHTLRKRLRAPVSPPVTG